MRLPNTFIIGMPRAASTSVSYYMRSHPEIFFPDPLYKEPHHYSTDIYPRQFSTDQEYESIFSAATNEKVVAEASVFYLWSEAACDLIPADSKVVLILRHPADWLPSFHAMMLRTGRQPIGDIRQAYWLGPATERYEWVTNYREMIRLAVPIKRYAAKFGFNLHIVNYDCFVRNPKAEMSRMFEFLGVDPQHQIDLVKYNSRNTFWAKRLLDKFPSLRNLAFKIPTPYRHKISGAIGKLFAKTDIGLDSQCIADINEIVRQELEKLKDVANLPGWLR